ncbi:MAG: hypothetical protein EP329_20290 [Deltaproteobacteria bacterium]|nr:MAG: hypothetical protein EP329_20290 [Deltaproteobacteria bacterium]
MQQHLLRLVAPALVVALALASPSADASPVDLFGLGARGLAMAGAVDSTAGGFEATYYNPAGLAFDRRPSFALGYQSASFDLTLNGEARAAREAPVLTIGFGVPLPLGEPLKDRLALGLAFAIPQSAILIADIPRPGAPSFVIVENRAQTVSVLGALAVRVSRELSVGVGALALAELTGDIAVAPNEEGKLGTRVKDELLADYALIAGAAYRPTPWIDLSLTWRSASTARFSLPITADLGESFGIPLPRLDVSGTAQYDPAELAVGVGARPAPWLLAAVSGVWQRWSAFPQPVAYTAVPEGTPAQPPPDFHDTVSVRLGFEGRFRLADDVTLLPRLGASLEPTPVPDQTGFHNHIDGNRVVLALGAGVLIGPVRVELAGQAHLIGERTSTKDPALVPDPATNPGAPTITGSGTIFVGALQLGLDL